MQASGKPAAVLEKIAEGKIKKFYEDTCLMNQAFVKDPNKTIEQLLKETIAALGENIIDPPFRPLPAGRRREGRDRPRTHRR